MTGVQTCALPISSNSARSEVDDKVEGLDAGANDYLAKPFHLAELEEIGRASCRERVSDVV